MLHNEADFPSRVRRRCRNPDSEGGSGRRELHKGTAGAIRISAHAPPGIRNWDICRESRGTAVAALVSVNALTECG